MAVVGSPEGAGEAASRQPEVPQDAGEVKVAKSWVIVTGATMGLPSSPARRVDTNTGSAVQPDGGTATTARGVVRFGPSK